MEFKKYTKAIKVNGHKVEVEVTIEVTEADEYDNNILFDQSFESKDQELEYRRKVERGELFAGNVIVTARAVGLEGFDSLGGCELKPNNMFNSEPFEKSVNFYLKSHGMEELAIVELKKNLVTEYDALINKAENYKKFKGGK